MKYYWKIDSGTAEIDAARAARACGVLTPDIVRKGGKFGVRWIAGSREWGDRRRLSISEKRDLLHGLLFRYVIADGDCHDGNVLMASGRTYHIDMEYAGNAAADRGPVYYIKQEIFANPRTAVGHATYWSALTSNDVTDMIRSIETGVHHAAMPWGIGNWESRVDRLGEILEWLS